MEKTYEMIKEKLDANICTLLSKPNMSMEDLKFLGESIDVLKDISIIEGMEDYSEEMEHGYSETSRDARRLTARNRSMTAAYEQGYIDGTSHARGRSPQTGRYVSRTEEMHHMDPIDYDHSGKRYYADMRSGHSIDDRMVAALEQMFDNAGSEHERGRIESVIAHIHNTGM